MSTTTSPFDSVWFARCFDTLLVWTVLKYHVIVMLHGV